MDVQPSCRITAIGSFPHLEPEAALSLVFEKFSSFPLWPQLPKRSFLEQMYVQYSEGMPGVVIDEAARRIYFRTGEGILPDLEEFYERVLADKIEHFSISENFAVGLYAFRRRLQGLKEISHLAVKGHLTGPVSFGLSVTDEERKPVLYHPELMEAVSMCLAMKAAWQVEFLRPLGSRVLLFVDEPYLSSLGSGYVSLREEDVRRHLGHVIGKVKSLGAMAGIHCCANTDWSLLLSSEAQILSFDAYEFGEYLFLYHEQLRSFLDRGGILAWGIVPTSPKAQEETPGTLLEKMESHLSKIERWGFVREEILRSSLLTPSCGMGSLSEDLSRRVILLLSELSMMLREKYSLP